jgi:hypothetical protein
MARRNRQIGGGAELERTFNLFSPPPITEFEASFKLIRDRLFREAKERGWEAPHQRASFYLSGETSDNGLAILTESESGGLF